MRLQTLKSLLAALGTGLLRLPFPKFRNLSDFIVSAAYAIALSYLFRMAL